MNSEMNCSMHSRRLNPHGTPESEFSNFECFQNYTAPEVFVQGLAGIVNQGDVEIMIRAQKQISISRVTRQGKFAEFLFLRHMVKMIRSVGEGGRVVCYTIRKFLRKIYLIRLQRFEKTNEMLLNCNALSTSRLKVASEEFKKHTKMLSDMKKDLDYIFKKIRVIKSKISVQYPDAFAQTQFSNKTFAEEAEEDQDITDKNDKDVLHAGENSEASASTAKPQKSSTEKKSSKEVGYIQMKHSPDAGRSSEEIEKRRSLISNKSTSTDNSNDSSDCTSDTG